MTKELTPEDKAVLQEIGQHIYKQVVAAGIDLSKEELTDIIDIKECDDGSAEITLVFEDKKDESTTSRLDVHNDEEGKTDEG
jgi:hypothetical protein